MSHPSQNRPDVEAIIAQLHVDQQALPSSEPSGGEVDEQDLHALLAEANRLCQLRPASGWKQLIRRPFRFLFADVYASNAATVRCLNRMTRLLSGEDLPEAGPFLENQRRRLTLLQQLNERVAALEAEAPPPESAP